MYLGLQNAACSFEEGLLGDIIRMRISYWIHTQNDGRPFLSIVSSLSLNISPTGGGWEKLLKLCMS